MAYHVSTKPGGKVVDIEEVCNKAKAVLARTYDEPTERCVELYKDIIFKIIETPTMTELAFKRIKGANKFCGKNSFLLQIFDILKARNQVDPAHEDIVRRRLRIKKGRSHSGVLVITVFTGPHPEYTDEKGIRHTQPFTCRNDCHYCPAQPGQPRSYLELEPGVLRANRNKFDARAQMWDRMQALYTIGHPVDKLEVLVLGATWSHYPLPYQEEFCRDLYYSANTFLDPLPRRLPMSLTEEKHINRTAPAKIIGLTLETRPDQITPEELVRFRHYGCTRVQLGLQHTHDDVLRAVNRGCTTEDAICAIRLLKDACFKIDIHTMPNLYGSSPEKDRRMYLDQLLALQFPPVPRRQETYNPTLKCHELYEYYPLRHPELQADQWKIYPTMITPWTKIKQLYEQGLYTPYSDQELEDLLLDVLAHMLPWIRINRLIRDISGDYIIVGADGNMRQELEHKLVQEGKRCNCIRCREVKAAPWDGAYLLTVRHYPASEGDEYFISAESHDNTQLYGFLRLRVPSQPINPVFPELSHATLLRELHVYGQLQKTTIPSPSSSHVQHKGIGKTLIAKAKDLSRNHSGFDRIAVIPGEGVRSYYEKHGFQDVPGLGHFMLAST